MSKEIDKLPLREVKSGNTTIVMIKYKGKTYFGQARIHPDDQNFYSPHLGRSIAGARARIKIYQALIKELSCEIKIKQTFFQGMFQGGFSEESQLQKKMIHNINKTKKRLVALKKDLDIERTALNIFLQDLDKCFRKVNKIREGKMPNGS